MRFCALMLIVLTNFFWSSNAQGEDIVIGLRVDTPPFASIDGDSGA